MAGEREPCPYRIFDDVGGAFLMGTEHSWGESLVALFTDLLSPAPQALWEAPSGTRSRELATRPVVRG